MPNHANRVLPDSLDYKLNFLKLTRNGKISLTIFNKKALYKALSLFQQTHIDIPKEPYNLYFALCAKESDRLGYEQDHDAPTEFVTYDASGDMTTQGEKFNEQKCKHFILNTKNKSPARGMPANRYAKSGSVSKYVTFTQGLTYWKYGKEYKYPDQAISDEYTKPCQPQSNYTWPTPVDAPERDNIEPAEELKEAIQSGNINKEGLEFLRGAFLHKPELLQTINDYLDTEGSARDPTYDQTNLPF